MNSVQEFIMNFNFWMKVDMQGSSRNEKGPFRSPFNDPSTFDSAICNSLNKDTSKYGKDF